MRPPEPVFRTVDNHPFGQSGMPGHPARLIEATTNRWRQSMQAVVFTEFGGPEVLRTEEVAEPQAGPGDPGT